MTRHQIINGLKRELVHQCPVAQRAQTRVLLAALEDQYVALMTTVRQEAFQEGTSTERKRQEAAHSSGFDLGYQHGLERAIGSIGQPARRLDDDEVASLPS